VPQHKDALQLRAARHQAEIHDASLQFVRKLSGFTKPSKANEEAFERAVGEIAASAEVLIRSLVTTAHSRNREVEAAKAKERSECDTGGLGNDPVRAYRCHFRIRISRWASTAFLSRLAPAPAPEARRSRDTAPWDSREGKVRPLGELDPEVPILERLEGLVEAHARVHQRPVNETAWIAM
jgi:hypothetical protein